jgi:hypothetical protein
MESTGTGPQFSWGDVEEWARRGLISQDQLAAIRAELASRQAAAPEASQPAPMREERPGLNLVTIAYYFGGFLALLGYTVFLGTRWSSLSYGMQLLAMSVTMALLLALGFVLRRFNYTLAGGLLIFVGTALAPLVAYTLAQTLGFWPRQPVWPDPGYDTYYLTVRPYWVYLEAVSLVVALVMLWLVRFPLITALAAFWVWMLSVDVARLIAGNETFQGDLEQVVSVTVGLALLALGLYLQRRTQQDYSRWLYLAGHIALIGGLGSLAFEYEGWLALLFLLVYLAFVVISVPLQRPVFLVFGAIGCFMYVSYLAFEVFGASLGFPIVLLFLGILIVLGAVGFQRYVRPWLERRFERMVPPPSAEVQP